MDQALLVVPDEEAGVKALAPLDAAHLEPVVALLAVFPEYADWRFVVSSPSLDRAHLKAHIKVAEALNGGFTQTLPTVMIFPAKDPFIRDRRRFFGKAKT